jgi:hypothetical protein
METTIPGLIGGIAYCIIVYVVFRIFWRIGRLYVAWYCAGARFVYYYMRDDEFARRADAWIDGLFRPQQIKT